MENDTIVAVVTPPGEGGVGIIRASGPLSLSLPRRLFPGLSAAWPSHRLRLGHVVEPHGGRTIDQAMGCVMRAPRSYTGEDVFEIHCHGSPLVLEQLLRVCHDLGCRAARPGEFTLRAFLNGRLDLSQAEAVIDVVRARSNAALNLAVQQLEGWLFHRIEPLRQDLMGALAHMEAMVDFVEDDIPPELDSSSQSRLESICHDLEDLLAGADQGVLLREGASLAIVGSPNVGKSSMLNGLLGSDRSIVTPIAGTTRDTIEESIQIGDIAFRVVDTAGLTRTEDPVEQLGVERSRRAIQGADVILLVLDASRPWSEADELTLSELEHRDGAGPVVAALNKSDLPRRLEADPVLTRVRAEAVVESSAVTAAGLVAVRDAVAGAFLGTTRDDLVPANVRHQTLMKASVDALRAALDGAAGGVPLDLIALDVRAATAALGEITGADVDDELLDRIFRDFCIGK